MFTRVFWRDVLARAGRNALQVVLPVVLLAQTTGTVTGLDWRATVDLTVAAVAVTVAKALAGLSADASAPTSVRALERAVPAAAAVLLGVLTAPAWSVFRADWTGISVAALSAAVAAVIHMAVDPPLTREQFRSAV